MWPGPRSVAFTGKADGGAGCTFWFLRRVCRFAEKLSAAFAGYGNLESDGRPTLSLTARELTSLVLGIEPDCLVIPAHAWTPWYGLYGSKSGFDSLFEAFGDMIDHVPAIETGLSSDPEMNWALPELSQKTIVSFSDAHSLPKLGAGK